MNPVPLEGLRWARSLKGGNHERLDLSPASLSENPSLSSRHCLLQQ